MVPAMAQRLRGARRRERIHQLVRSQALGRKPSGGIGERGGAAGDDESDQRQRADCGTRGRAAGLTHSIPFLKTWVQTVYACVVRASIRNARGRLVRLWLTP